MLEGWACRYKALPDGRRQIVSILVPGDLCDLYFHLPRHQDHSIGSISALRIAELARSDLDALILNHPRVAQALYWSELVTVAVQREWTLNIGQRSAYERIAHLICELFSRLRVVGLTDGNSFDFPLTQQDLGETSGLTSVHVNRTLRQLRADELIDLDRRRLCIRDVDALMEVAMFNPNYLHLDREGRHLDAPE